jgi:hypothetical protein
VNICGNIFFFIFGNCRKGLQVCIGKWKSPSEQVAWGETNIAITMHQTKLLITNHNHHPHMPLPRMYQSQPSNNLYHNKCINHAQNTYSKLTNKGPLEIHHTIHKMNTINPYIKPCATTSILCSLNHVPFIIQSYTNTTNKCLSQ